MPRVKLNDISLYYEVHGSEEPLLFIGGLANKVTDFTERSKIIDLLSHYFKVIVFDNRGAGQSDKPDIPYSIEMMADDAVGLLRELKITQAYILGVSMGGRIALDITLRYPEIVKKLVLVSTGSRRIRTLRRFMKIDILPRIPLFRKEYHHPYFAFNRQRKASSTYTIINKLHEISTPTLIMHGKNDTITPLKLAEELHKGINKSKLTTFDGGHLFLFKNQREFTDAVIRFLNEH